MPRIAPGGAPALAQGDNARQLQSLLRNGQWGEAEQALRRAIERGAGPPVHRLLAVVLTRQLRDREAGLEFLTAIEGHGQAPVMWRREYGETLVRLQRCGQALPLLTAVHQEAGEVRDAVNLAGCLNELGQLEESRTVLRAVLEKEPEEQRVWLLLASTERDLGNEAAAKTAYERALEQDPLSVVAARNLALLVAELEPERAAGLLDEVLSRAPFDPAALQLRARLFLRAGDRDRAQELLRRFADASRLQDGLDNLRTFVAQHPEETDRAVELVELLLQLGEASEANRLARRLLGSGRSVGEEVRALLESAAGHDG